MNFEESCGAERDEENEKSVVEEEDKVDEEEEEEEEPKLKYQRLGSSAAQILSQNTCSCFAIHSKFMTLGTTAGIVYVLDFDGNEIRQLNNHSAKVNCISIDSSGDHIASCGEDGKVCVVGLYSEAQNVIVSYTAPILSVALHPDYSKLQTRNFVNGSLDGNLLMNEKGWFGNSFSTLHSAQGKIHSIQWRGHFIAWGSENGIKIHDLNTSMIITHISFPQSPSILNTCIPHLCWKSDSCLIVGWGEIVKVAVIHDRKNFELQMGFTSGYATRSVELVAICEVGYLISGIAPYENHIAILSYNQEEQSKGVASRPELKIITYENDEISNDALSILHFQQYSCKDYILAHLSLDGIYFIVSPHDIVVGKPRDMDDHISFLLQRGNYKDALCEAEKVERELKTHSLLDIGQTYISYLMDSHQYDIAAKVCAGVLKTDAKLWESWIFTFAKLKQLQCIASYIPTKSPLLSSTCYEMVLDHFLRSDVIMFQKIISEWPSELYNTKTIITSVLEKLKLQPNIVILMDCLSELYANDQQFDKALHILLRLKRGNVFNLIVKHDLYDSIGDKIALLFEFDLPQATNLLIHHIDRVPVNLVVEQTKVHHRSFLHYYLDQLFSFDSSAAADFHELQVELYAEFDPGKLLPFLRQSNFYPLEKALILCEQRDLVPEMVFLLGRIANHRKALSLIMNRLRDVSYAISFCKEQADEELWEDLIKFSMDKPEFIHGLLNHVGTHIDPILLIQRIPFGLRIPDLKNSLVRILQDFQLQISLREGCKKILVSDSVSLFNKHVNGIRKGISCPSTLLCCVCGCGFDKDVFSTFSSSTTPNQPYEALSCFILFHCKHFYHWNCIRKDSQEESTQANSTCDIISLAGGRLIQFPNPCSRNLFCILCRNDNLHQKNPLKLRATIPIQKDSSSTSGLFQS